MIRHILVVCVGNICRSPMAEALLRSGLRGQDEITIESAGLAALVDHPAAEHAVELMSERGKVHRLGEWRDMEISDPYQQPKAAFAETLQDIEDGVADWVTRLAT